MAENIINPFELAARFPKGPEGAHYEAIGRFVKNWAAFELFIQSAIWRFANVDDEVGYCLTAQIPNYERALDALISLVRLKGANQQTIQRMTKFAKDSKKLALKRNEIVHSGLYFDPSTGPRHPKVTASKAKGAAFHYNDRPTETLNKWVDEIYELIDTFDAMINEVAKELAIELRPSSGNPP